MLVLVQARVGKGEALIRCILGELYCILSTSVSPGRAWLAGQLPVINVRESGRQV